MRAGQGKIKEKMLQVEKVFGQHPINETEPDSLTKLKEIQCNWMAGCQRESVEWNET